METRPDTEELEWLPKIYDIAIINMSCFHEGRFKVQTHYHDLSWATLSIIVTNQALSK